MSPATKQGDYAIEIEGFDELLERLALLSSGRGPFEKYIVTTMRAAMDVLGEQIDARTPVNTDALRSSRYADMYGVPLDLTGEVGTPLPYGLPVEHGRAPGKMPPVDAIEYWVKRKGIVFIDKETGKPMKLHETALLIARSIAAHGTKGAFMYRDGLEAARPTIEKLFNDLADDLIRELAR